MSRDKQPAEGDGLCSTDEMMSQMNLQDQNDLEQQGNNPAQPLEFPQLPAQPAEDPLLPLEGLEHQVLDIPLPHDMQDFLQPPLEELEDQVLPDIPQLPAQPAEDPLLPLEGLEHQAVDIPLASELQDFLQTPIEELKDQVLLDIPQQPAQPVPQPPDQVLVLPQPVNQMSTSWDNSHYSPLIPAQPVPQQPAQPVPQPPDQVPVLPQPVNQTSTTWDNSHYSPLIPAQPVPRQPAQPVPQPPDQVLVLPQPVNQMSTAWDNSRYSPLIPAQPVPQQPAQPVPQPPDQVPVLPQPLNQMSTDNSRYSPSISGIASDNSHSFFKGISPYFLSSFLTGIAPYPLSSGIASNNGHYNPSSTGTFWNNNLNPLSARLNPHLSAAQGPVFLQPSQEDGCSVPNSIMTSGNNDGNKDGNNDGRPIPGTQAYRNERYVHFKKNKKPKLNTEKKIRYLVRKKLSDIRPRKKGRYVGISEAEPSHRYGLGASLQSQELASQNNVHRQVYVGLIPPNWPNAPSEPGEEELRAAGLWESDAGGGDDHVPGEDH